MARLDIAWRGLTCRFVTPATAGRGLAWPQACGRWLPVWLPAISLAMLTFGCQTAFLRADLEEPMANHPGYRIASSSADLTGMSEDDRAARRLDANQGSRPASRPARILFRLV